MSGSISNRAATSWSGLLPAIGINLAVSERQYWMHTLRKYLCWVFALASLVFAQIALSTLLLTIRRHAGIPLLARLLGPTILIFLATVFGLTWWNVWREKRSARIWGIAASLINILLPL